MVQLKNNFNDWKLLWKFVPMFWKVSMAVLMIVTITLFVVGFILPPQGEISGSVLLAGGILMLPVCVFIIGCARVAGVGGAVEIDLKNGNIKFGKDETTTKEI